MEKTAAQTKPSRVIALAGNPNVGKSTVFNTLTGLHQHTGNWSGKTVSCCWGRMTHRGREYTIVDLPGTYSLMAHSKEEEEARDFIESGDANVTVVLCDATCLERNLNLVLQTIALGGNVVVCVNLLDEAEKKGIRVDIPALSAELGVPVVGTSANRGAGLTRLVDVAAAAAECPPRKGARLTDDTAAATAMVRRGEAIAARTVSCSSADAMARDRRLDARLTGKLTGIPIMLALLTLVLWLTISGANLPSEWLAQGLFWVQDWLTDLFAYCNAPPWLHGALVLGVYRVLAWVVSVMLPPMAIFFPLFTLLEDFGYLPRVAFVLDHAFQKAKACGKQALTMCSA